MARKYNRDKRGRFASSGSGATERGSRLTGKGSAKTMRVTPDTAPRSSAPKGTVSGSSRGRVLQRAERIGGFGAVGKARQSLKTQVARVKGGRTRRANLEAMPLSKRSKSFQAKRAAEGVARALRPR
jgi:hypothetical protein